MKAFWDWFTKAFKSLITLVVIIVPSYYFGTKGMPTEMGLSIVAGALAAGFLNIDKIELLKGAGFEARMKAEVQKAVDEAYATIEQLKTLGKPTIISLLKIIVYHNRLSGLKCSDEHKLIKDLKELARSMSIDNSPDFTETIDVFYRFRTWDKYSFFVLKALNNLNGNDFHLLRDGLESLNKSNTKDYPSREQIMTVLGDYASKLSSEALKLLDDYLYYVANKEPQTHLPE